VGYVHFEELFGDRNSVLRVGGVTVVAVDSTEPDSTTADRPRALPLDRGAVRRSRRPPRVRPHHTCCRSRNGRERNVVNDAGDAIECLQRQASISS